ncbi:MAG TPA: hypothetical protein VI933_00135 [archaeon]|nr:hypothetical protein [archaeon]
MEDIFSVENISEKVKETMRSRKKVFLISSGILTLSYFFRIDLGFFGLVIFLIAFALAFYKIVDLIT